MRISLAVALLANLIGLAFGLSGPITQQDASPLPGLNVGIGRGYDPIYDRTRGELILLKFCSRYLFIS